MTDSLVYRRIVLKLSGEALKGKLSHGFSGEAIASTAGLIKDATDAGVQMAIVVGGGNFFRGLSAGDTQIERCTADSIGMLATVMNGLALRDGLLHAGVRAELMSALAFPGLTQAFDSRAATKHLAEGTVLILSGGTGHPFFTTDTTAALRACQLSVDAVVKATKVDGVYSADPHKHPDAVRFRSLAYGDAIQKRLGVMDSTAFSLCMDNAIPILVCNFSEKGGLLRVLSGDRTKATLVANVETVPDAPA